MAVSHRAATQPVMQAVPETAFPFSLSSSPSGVWPSLDLEGWEGSWLFFFLSLLFFSSYSKNTGKAANYCQLQHSFLQWHLSTGNSSETTNHFSNKPPNSCQMIQDFDHYWPEHTQTKDFMMKDISHLESPEPSSPSEHWCCFFLNKAFQEVAKIALKP